MSIVAMMAIWIKMALGPGHIVLASLPKKRTELPQKKFRPISLVAKRLYGLIKMPVGMDVGLGPGNCVRWGPSSPRKRTARTQFLANVNSCSRSLYAIARPLLSVVCL